MKKVLIVDDSEPVRAYVRDALARAGYGVLDAFDGADALEKLAADPEIALVLCDINMPRMNGLDLIEEAARRGLPAPFVMLTSEAVPSLMRRARAAGAKAWIVKPVKPEMLVSVVHKLLGPSGPQPSPSQSA